MPDHREAVSVAHCQVRVEEPGHGFVQVRGAEGEEQRRLGLDVVPLELAVVVLDVETTVTMST